MSRNNLTIPPSQRFERKQMEYAKIYGIVSKSTGKVVYIGKANNPAERFKGHLQDSLRRKTPLYDWMRSGSGVGANYVVLASATSEDWQSLEKQMIAQYRSEGKLLNLADGGDQPSISVEQRRKNALSMNAKRESGGIKRQAWLLKKRMNRFLNDCRKDGRFDSFNPKIEQIKAKLRYAGWKNPQLFGEYKSL